MERCVRGGSLALRAMQLGSQVVHFHSFIPAYIPCTRLSIVIKGCICKPSGSDSF